MTAHVLLVALCALSAMVSSLYAAPTIVYDNTVNQDPRQHRATPVGTETSNSERGDQVTLSGTARKITKLDASMAGSTAAVDLRVSFYEDDGLGGEPQSLIWRGEFRNAVQLPYFPGAISFTIPSVHVPDTFTWTIESRNVIGTSPLIYWFDPPAVGSSFDYSWTRYSGTSEWIRRPPAQGLNASYGVRLWAVPEPAGIILLSAGSFGILIRRCRLN
jgi:hypothetical protein